jgi:hypothetical protein
MSITADADRGARAARLLEDPVFDDAFKAVEQAIFDQWAASPIRDHEGQHELRLMLNLLRDVRASLEQTMVDGKLAVEELKRLNARVLTPKQFFGR